MIANQTMDIDINIKEQLIKSADTIKNKIKILQDEEDNANFKI